MHNFVPLKAIMRLTPILLEINISFHYNTLIFNCFTLVLIHSQRTGYQNRKELESPYSCFYLYYEGFVTKKGNKGLKRLYKFSR